MMEHDEDWSFWYKSARANKPKYVVGNVLQPIDNVCGYAVIASITNNKIVGKCYIIITDFGNKLVLTEDEVDQSFTVIGWQDVLERAKEQQELLERTYYELFNIYLSEI